MTGQMDLDLAFSLGKKSQVPFVAKHAGKRTDGKGPGGAELPIPVKLAMKLGSKVMTKTAYWV